MLLQATQTPMRTISITNCAFTDVARVLEAEAADNFVGTFRNLTLTNTLDAPTVWISRSVDVPPENVSVTFEDIDIVSPNYDLSDGAVLTVTTPATVVAARIGVRGGKGNPANFQGAPGGSVTLRRFMVENVVGGITSLSGYGNCAISVSDSRFANVTRPFDYSDGVLSSLTSDATVTVSNCVFSGNTQPAVKTRSVPTLRCAFAAAVTVSCADGGRCTVNGTMLFLINNTIESNFLLEAPISFNVNASLSGGAIRNNACQGACAGGVEIIGGLLAAGCVCRGARARLGVPSAQPLPDVCVCVCVHNVHVESNVFVWRTCRIRGTRVRHAQLCCVLQQHLPAPA
jgi:hypothetical protein